MWIYIHGRALVEDKAMSTFETPDNDEGYRDVGSAPTPTDMCSTSRVVTARAPRRVHLSGCWTISGQSPREQRCRSSSWSR